MDNCVRGLTGDTTPFEPLGHFCCWTVPETTAYIEQAYWGARLLSQHP